MCAYSLTFHQKTSLPSVKDGSDKFLIFTYHMLSYPLGIAVLLLLLVAAKSALHLHRARKLVQNARPYEQKGSRDGDRILFLGDSTACGVGASSPVNSVAGLLGKSEPEVTIENRGHTGMRVKDLLQSFHPESWERYQTIVIQIGSNDITHGTESIDLTLELALLFDRASRVANNVVVLHGGNVGNAPIFPWPISAIMNRRTRKLRKIIRDLTKDSCITYIDLCDAEQQITLEKNPTQWFAADGFHPNDALYSFWYTQLRGKI